MRLLLDANLSPSLIDGLTDAGFDALHVGDIDLLTASDTTIVEYARANGLVVPPRRRGSTRLRSQA